MTSSVRKSRKIGNVEGNAGQFDDERPKDVHRRQIDTESDDDNDEPVKDVKSRDWNFTWNNYPSNFVDELLEKLDSSTIRYIIMGRELAPETGTPHIQGFVMFRNPRAVGKNMRRSGKPHARSLRGLFPTISWHKVYSTPHVAAAYCRKTDVNAIEFGERPMPSGERTDIHSVAAELLAGAKPTDLVVSHPAEYIKYGKGINMAYHDLHRHRTERPRCIWLYGRSGLGKNSIVRRNHGEDYYVKSDGTPYFIGYEYQQAVVLDEFTTFSNSPKGWRFESLLQLLDCYKLNVEVKGGHAPFSSPFIYITSPHPPDHFYPAWKDLSQVLRRLDEVIEVISTDKCRSESKWSESYYSKDRVVEPTFTTTKLDEIRKEIPFRTAMRAVIVPKPPPVPGKGIPIGVPLNIPFDVKRSSIIYDDEI